MKDDKLEEYTNELRKLCREELRKEIVFFGNQLIEDNQTAQEFWEKLRLYVV